LDPLSLSIAGFDLVLALLLPILAYGAIASADLFRAIVLFISLGLLLALAWARLSAPDVALAEAAIGAGFTGALLLAALDRLTQVRPNRKRRDQAVDG
jgi:uncharacterized MnhB-related membrane protein